MANNEKSIKSSKAGRLAKNSALFAIGELASKVIIFLMVPLYTYSLSTEEYSISDLITTTVALASPFFTLVIYEAVMRFTLDKDSDKQTIFSIGFWIFMVGSIIVGIISYVIFLFIPILKDYWLLFFIYYEVFNFFNIAAGFIKGLEHLKLFTIVGIINTFLMVLLNMLFLLYFKMGIEGYLWATIISTGFSSILIFVFERLDRYIISPTKIGKPDWTGMLRYAMPMIPNSAMWWINNSSDRYLVTFVISTAANGIYSVAYKIPSIFSVLTSVFMQAWQISVVDDFGTKEGTAFFNKTYDFYLRCCITVSSLLILSSELLAKFLFLNEFYTAWKFSIVLILGFCFHSIAGFLGTVYTTAKKTNMLFVSTTISAVFNIVFTFILLKVFGVMGAAIATTLSYLLVYIIRRIDSRKYIDIESNLKLFAIEYMLIITQIIAMLFDFGYLSTVLSVLLFLLIVCLNKEIPVRMFGMLLNKIKL